MPRDRKILAVQPKKFFGIILKDVEKKQPLHFLAMLVEELLTVRVRLT